VLCSDVRTLCGCNASSAAVFRLRDWENADVVSASRATVAITGRPQRRRRIARFDSIRARHGKVARPIGIVATLVKTSPLSVPAALRRLTINGQEPGFNASVRNLTH
jgi:hypothetical protein